MGTHRCTTGRLFDKSWTPPSCAQHWRSGVTDCMTKLQPCEIATAAETESNGRTKQPTIWTSKIDIRIQNLINNRILTSDFPTSLSGTPGIDQILLHELEPQGTSARGELGAGSGGFFGALSHCDRCCFLSLVLPPLVASTDSYWDRGKSDLHHQPWTATLVKWLEKQQGLLATGQVGLVAVSPPIFPEVGVSHLVWRDFIYFWHIGSSAAIGLLPVIVRMYEFIYIYIDMCMYVCIIYVEVFFRHFLTHHVTLVTGKKPVPARRSTAFFQWWFSEWLNCAFTMRCARHRHQSSKTSATVQNFDGAGSERHVSFFRGNSHVSIYLSVCLSIHPSTYPPIYISTYLSNLE